ncbi:acetylglutamate kinase [Streptomyces griseus]|uniref:acetylglutamate kinase n=1 Tax=Streptomyces griseus subsp. griseus (strain JCM 4626 / CBS 651.72 / NBRC 13350 / KCC S-0626 / ISP 5235) TaxID=455632 RepID=B1VMJ9_STRGG|nr:acetylglutamate kinase [Streptomyces griseus]MYR15516.1 acetylglutamate kinase [Streptomyces sp. SID724]MBW3705960.1 acetylglutamate kinase [Streptomyces griseus]SEE81116.1 acetylglutamate kinase [Streptomyces griseus]SQA23122.1 acetylglutamate kinase [Streptomyces griseus]BAG20309.1 putative acetylglutamate kinase [Streptomyces griseus subsp. griseus NBRC 13350]
MSASPATPTVVKLGGSCLDDLDGTWWDDLARIGRDRPLILVHGWSKPLKKLDARYSEPSAILRDRYGNQSRWTTPEVIDDIKTVSAVLAEDVLARLAGRGITAERLLGSDGLVAAGPGERWWWRQKQLVELENLVGPITGVDPAPLKNLRPGHAHLVTPLARNAAGREVNTDADRAAAAIAGATGAPDLVLVTDVGHLLIDDRPVRRISAADAAAFRDKGAKGGMRKKLRAAGEALDHGVERVVIGSAAVSELLDGSTGTVITGARTPTTGVSA